VLVSWQCSRCRINNFTQPQFQVAAEFLLSSAKVARHFSLSRIHSLPSSAALKSSFFSSAGVRYFGLFYAFLINFCLIFGSQRFIALWSLLFFLSFSCAFIAYIKYQFFGIISCSRKLPFPPFDRRALEWLHKPWPKGCAHKKGKHLDTRARHFIIGIVGNALIGKLYAIIETVGCLFLCDSISHAKGSFISSAVDIEINIKIFTEVSVRTGSALSFSPNCSLHMGQAIYLAMPSAAA